MSETTCECGRTGVHTCNGLGEKGYQSIDPDSAEERVLRYAQLIHEACGCDGCPVHPEDVAGARAAIAVADEEQARLKWLVRHHADIYAGACEDASRAEAEVERLKQGLYPLTQWTIEQATQLADGIGTSEGSLFVAWINERKRADAAEAQVERLTRECLDREATETDARERLRQAEATLAAVEALHVPNADGSACQFDGFCWPCETATVVSGD